MAWVVDTSLLVDVFENDPRNGLHSARCLQIHLNEGLVACPVSYVEFSPVCGGKQTVQEAFLEQIGVNWLEPWLWNDTAMAHELWNRCVQSRRQGAAAKRPVADLLIGAFAYRFQGILTRNAQDFKRLCPGLVIRKP